MEIVRLGPGDEARLRTIRLRALRDAPDAFGSTAVEVAARPPESWSAQILTLPTFVAVNRGQDVGLVRYAPDEEHTETGWLISMWVSPEIRREGVGSALIDAVVELATSKGWLNWRWMSVTTTSRQSRFTRERGSMRQARWALSNPHGNTCASIEEC